MTIIKALTAPLERGSRPLLQRHQYSRSLHGAMALSLHALTLSPCQLRYSKGILVLQVSTLVGLHAASFQGSTSKQPRTGTAVQRYQRRSTKGGAC